MGTIKEDTVKIIIDIETALEKIHKMVQEDWESISRSKEDFEKILNIMSQLTESLRIISEAALVDEKRNHAVN